MAVDSQVGRESAVLWHTLSADEALSRLGVSEQGLSGERVLEQRRHFGLNELPRAAREGPLELLWRQINSPLIYVLLGSAALAMLLGKGVDGLFVLAVIVVNMIIGFLQEFRAQKAIEALTAMVPQVATVVRDGARRTVPAAELVPGDIVTLQSGDRVPADMRLIRVKNLQIEEAALTGESIPVQKQLKAVDEHSTAGDRTCLAFGGTFVTYGAATAVVTATGASTELGRISTLLKETTTLETPLTRALAMTAKYIALGIAAVSMALVIIGTGRMMGQGLSFSPALRDAIVFAVALAVGAIPEGLPAMVTIILAVGVQRMAARRAIVRKLSAVETLGSTTVICTDKTGTLTRNEMTVQELWTPAALYEVTGIGYAPQGELRHNGARVTELTTFLKDLVLYAALCNDAALRQEGSRWAISGDPTEAALVVVAEKSGLAVADARLRYPRVDAIPFESEHQFMATLHDDPQGNQRIILKGAPEVILSRCQDAGDVERIDTEAVHQEVERLAARGMRVLAIAAKTPPQRLAALHPEDVTGGFTLLGMQGMIDPPRPEAIEAVRVCHAAGITVKMITGDHKGTARSIGQQLGLIDDGHVITGVELDGADDARFSQIAAETNVFARVAPEHKLRLVRELQNRAQVVAMTGDGVNDAPALKQANIGVAMGITGTAVAKESADIVLTDDNFASIAAAVEEGRRVYDNLIKSLAFLVPTNLGQALVLMWAVMLFPFDAFTGELLLPIRPTQLLWINMITSLACGLPLAFEAQEPNVMRRPPRHPGEPVLGGFVLLRTLLVAALITAGGLFLFLHEYRLELARGVMDAVAVSEAQTMTVVTIVLFQIFYVLNCRSLKDSIFRIGLFSNPALYAGIAVLLLLQVAFVYAPPLNALFGTAALTWDAWVKCAMVAVTVLPVISIEKWFRQRRASAGDQYPPGGNQGRRPISGNAST